MSFFTQTGIFTGAVMLHVMSAETQRLPVSKSIDVGNKIDVDEVDFLNFIKDDPETKVVGLYIESVRDPGYSWRRRARFARPSRSCCSSLARQRKARARRHRILVHLRRMIRFLMTDYANTGSPAPRMKLIFSTRCAR